MMRKLVGIGFFVAAITVASAQIPVPCLNQPSVGRASSIERITPRATMTQSSFVSTMASYTRSTIGSETRLGASLAFQVSLFRTPSEAIDIFGGVMFRYRNSSETVNLDEYTPFGIRNRFSSNPFNRGIRLGIGFIGLDYTFYLSDGNLRPYVGAGAMLLGWPYQSGVAGTIAPDVKAGIQAHLSSGFSGFAEVKHVFGLPVVVGADSPPLRGFTGFSFGFAFAPRWN